MEVQFDPGFVQHMSAFVPSIQHVYGSLTQYKNFNQKKMQFKMYYPKIQGLIKNYIGFYLGCILWAIYIKQFKNADILNNLCYGGEYNEKETLEEIDFVKDYLEQLKKDAKYYISQEFNIDETSLKIIDAYKEFLKDNKGFVNVKTTDDLVVSNKFKTPENLNFIRQEINKVVENGRLHDLVKLADKVI